jgi:methionyl-tRNA formyltransferase
MESCMARVVFMGTPDFAVPSLQSLYNDPGFEVVGVVTQPDRPAGRGRTITTPPVKQAAQEAGIPVFQPETLRSPEAVQQLRDWACDVIVVVAFGQILRTAVLDLPPFGCVNVHASLLPRWRGAAPIQYALRAGDSETGITIMKMDRGLDSGPIISQQAIPMADQETGESLHDKLAALGAALLPGGLHQYLAGALIPIPQPKEGITLAPTLQKQDGVIDWAQPARLIDQQVRAYTPWPGTHTTLNGEIIKVIRGHVKSSDPGYPLAGTLVADQANLAVQTGDGLYVLDVIQPAGKKPMTGQSYLIGHPDSVGHVLGAE